MTKPEGPAQEPQRVTGCTVSRDDETGLMLAKLHAVCVAGRTEEDAVSSLRLVVQEIAKQQFIAVPATPTPSQPAGAREWLFEHAPLAWNGPNRVAHIVSWMDAYARQQTAASELKGWQDAINSVRASLQQYPDGGGDVEIMLAVEAIVKAQTAAKDADNKRLMFAMRDAERERDSLREWIRECLFIAEGGKPTDESFTLGVIVAKLQEADAALKAGKDGHDV